jgi:hypothetical protein
VNFEASGVLEDFKFYLNRHIELDSGEHGPLAGKLLELLCADDSAKWQAAKEAAMSSLLARKNLWDGMLDVIAT